MNEEHPLANLMPVKMADKLEMAKAFKTSGLMPASLDTPEKILIALQMGHELGLSPMVSVNNITAINGRPVMSADLMVAVARKHPDFAGMNVNTEEKKVTVTVKRRTNGEIEEFTNSFSLDEARQAGLLDKKYSPWLTYPKRMMKHRATAFALRDAFPDALAGFYAKEEMDEVEPINVPVTVADPLFSAIKSAIETEKNTKKKNAMIEREIRENTQLTEEQRQELSAMLSQTQENTPSKPEEVVDGQIDESEQKAA